MQPTFQLAARLTVTIARPLVIGQTAVGLREVIPITGGTVDGPRLKGKVVPGGADWCLTRGDGIAEVWARYTIALEDGMLVGILNAGFAHPQADGSYRGHTVPQFEAAPGPLDWLRRSIFVGTLHAPPSGEQVELEFYEVV